MLFNSIAFLFFLPIVVLLYFTISGRYRWFLLLFASCFFYMFFKPIYIAILGFTIVVDYFAGMAIEGANENARKRIWLILSIIVNVGVLVLFKYYNFLNENVVNLFAFFGVAIHPRFLTIILPIGLSFHTFQAMSYTIEVYRGNQKAERHFGIYALYVMFFPQLVAGPIERPQNMIHQFHEMKFFDTHKVVSGLRLILWGMFKKIVIADRLSSYTDNIFNNPYGYSGIMVLFSVLFFSFQIYCDFSGYTDIAIGSARILGINLMKNFDFPYMSKSIAEFWRRWHISLSTWFRDYLYIPLGGNRGSSLRKYFNLLIVFSISGIWHGANWTFLIWGILHWLFLVTEDVKKRFFKKPSNFIFKNQLNIITTFCLVTLAWIFFRANSFTVAFFMIQKIFIINSIYYFIISNINIVVFNCILVIILLIVDNLASKTSFIKNFDQRSIFFKWAVYYLLLISIFFLGVFENKQFIYFQF